METNISPEDIDRLVKKLKIELSENCFSSPLALLTAKDIHKIFNLPEAYIKRLWEIGKLDYYSRGKRRLSFRTDVEEFLLRVKERDEVLEVSDNYSDIDFNVLDDSQLLFVKKFSNLDFSK